MGKMNKKGVDSIITLFAATVEIILVIAFFTIFATLLLSYSPLNKEQTTTSMTSNLIGFLQKDISGLTAWQKISAGDIDANLGNNVSEFLRETYPLGRNEYHSRYMKGYYKDKGEDKEFSLYPANMLGMPGRAVFFWAPSLTVQPCDKNNKNEKIVEVYIPQLSSDLKKIWLCVGT